MAPGPRFASLSGWLEWQETLHPQAIAPGLERVARVLDRTGWRRPAAPVLTVAGTNGKGSCVALLEAMLGAAGYRVATFTSPHLVDYRERIRVAGESVSATSLIVAFERIAAALGSDTLTFFEFNALAALLVFESARPGAIVLEVGMGGRLDAVNVVDPDVAIVTSIGLDHVEWLGSDVDAISREKAGIFRAGIPAIYGGVDPMPEIEQTARHLGAVLRRRGIDFDVALTTEGRWSYQGPHGTFEDLPAPALAGAHQIDNAATALAALGELATRLPMTQSAIERGLQIAFVPGRFQRVHAMGREWILDVAHNPAAARVLADTLRRTPTEGTTFAVCAMLADKDVDGVLAGLRSSIDTWFVASTPGARGLNAAQLAEHGARAGLHLRISGGIGEAMQQAMQASTSHDRIVVFGSFHTVGPAIEWLRRHTGARDAWLRSD